MLPIIVNEIESVYRLLYDGGLNEKQMLGARERLYSLHHLIRASVDNWPIKTCSCGRQHTATGWMSLPLVGYQGTDQLGGEMRNCMCGSTMFMVARRTPFAKSKSQLLHGTIVSSNKLSDTRPPFSLHECINISEAYSGQEHMVYLDKWDDRQVIEAALFGKAPEWEEDPNGNLIPLFM